MKTGHGRHSYRGNSSPIVIRTHYSYSGGIDGFWTVYRPDGTIRATNLSWEDFNANKAQYEVEWKEEMDAFKASNS